ncbi:OFA family MFS transporter [Cyanobacterium aponinum FACHB-4101]|uniref:L-lactate MFS transporter n=1 Tax=Cyanobacterium aponinum TaxID=379064 RepID=UPI00168057A6|nr:OFA family MFS transporter [Cyanobacterium aponinum]MBD2394610.1 OFA family MFS transporter [Cyanobacterium aponinum FACHB-4101]
MDSCVDLKLFSLPAKQGRWLLIPVGIIVLLCLGSVYSWSIFRKPLETQLNITATESLLPYTIGLLSYSILMPIAGFFITRIGTRIITAIGGLIVGIGYILASFAPNITLMTLSYGVVAGAGVGIAYGVPMAVVAKWFPDKKGLAVGLTIIGFGLSPLISAPLSNQLIISYGVNSTLRILGITFILIISTMAIALKLPPSHWNLSFSSTSVNNASVMVNYTPMLKTTSFYGLWFCYAIGALVGLSAIGISSPVGEEIIQIDSNFAARSVSLFALFNGISRPLFGWLTDRFSPRQVAIASFTIIIIACTLMISAQAGDIKIYLIAFCLFWFCLGGWLAMAPTMTLRFFNPDNYAQNYGIVFTAYGMGALIGTVFVGQMRDLFGSYTYGFYIMGFLGIIGIFIAQFALKSPPSSKDYSE